MTRTTRISWWLIVGLSALLAVNHAVLIFVLDDPVLFCGFAGMNAIAVLVLINGYPQRLTWAWWAVWIEVATIASVAAVGDGSDDTGLRVSYGVVAVVIAVAQLRTRRWFRG